MNELFDLARWLGKRSLSLPFLANRSRGLLSPERTRMILKGTRLCQRVCRLLSH